ncbi:MAG: hypothetical protein LBR13_03705 [Dysgonamonadaceae bacterium]|jgi:hypothetical protein|nr:hypothetical protein [Dysgonamonadaceae bacterium]
MKRLFYFLFVALSATAFVSCLDETDSDSVYYFRNEPAFVVPAPGGNGEDMVLRTAYGMYYVSPEQLAKFNLAKDDLIWTDFTVLANDANKISFSDSEWYYKVAGLYAFTVDSSAVRLPDTKAEFEANLKDDYSADIDLAMLYLESIDNLLFFEFTHQSGSGTVFGYEIILDPESTQTSGTPTFYIRAKALASATSKNSANSNVYAFDLDQFVQKYKELYGIGTGSSVRFNLRYKVRTENGEDVYRDFMSNPISWRFYDLTVYSNKD